MKYSKLTLYKRTLKLEQLAMRENNVDLICNFHIESRLKKLL